MPRQASSQLHRRAPHRAGVGTSPIAPGAAPTRDTGLPLPHERDESLGETDASPRPVGRQAKQDLDAGLVDTDLRATPGLDAAQRRHLLKRER